VAAPFDSKIDWLIRPTISVDTMGYSQFNPPLRGIPIGVGFGYKISDNVNVRALVDSASLTGGLGTAAIGVSVSM
jgi:hypothetical protein